MCDAWDAPATHTSPVTTGWPAGMLQDDSRELSKWLAGRSGARQCARDAAATVTPAAAPAVAAAAPETAGGVR